MRVGLYAAIITISACGSDRLEYHGPEAIPQDEPNQPTLPEDPIMVGECPADATARFDQDEIYVFGNGDPLTASAVLTVSDTGWYDVYDETIAESGPSQTNEAAYFRIANAANPTGIPRWANCDDEWVVDDTDNDEPPPADSKIYIGTFWLIAGDNALEMNHYCILYGQDRCTDFHESRDSGSACGVGINSVHLSGSAFCLVEAPM